MNLKAMILLIFLMVCGSQAWAQAPTYDIEYPLIRAGSGPDDGFNIAYRTPFVAGGITEVVDMHGFATLNLLENARETYVKEHTQDKTLAEQNTFFVQNLKRENLALYVRAWNLQIKKLESIEPLLIAANKAIVKDEITMLKAAVTRAGTGRVTEEDADSARWFRSAVAIADKYLIFPVSYRQKVGREEFGLWKDTIPRTNLQGLQMVRGSNDGAIWRELLSVYNARPGGNATNVSIIEEDFGLPFAVYSSYHKRNDRFNRPLKVMGWATIASTSRSAIPHSNDLVRHTPSTRGEEATH